MAHFKILSLIPLLGYDFRWLTSRDTGTLRDLELLVIVARHAVQLPTSTINTVGALVPMVTWNLGTSVLVVCIASETIGKIKCGECAVCYLDSHLQASVCT